MRVLVTGIGGFVGSRLARHLRDRGDRVSGTFWEVRPDLPGVDLHEADLADAPGLERVVRETDPEAVVHLAGLSHVGDSWKRKEEYFRVNVGGTGNLLAAAGDRRGRRVRRVVVASSAEVYGAVPEERQPIREDEPVGPLSPYAETKVAAEALAQAAGAVVARSFNLIGPGQAPHFALPAFAAQLAAIRRGEQEPKLKVGNLSAQRDFVHVDDGAAALRLLAEKGEPGGVYNIASGRACSIEEALRRLMAVAGVEAEITTDPGRMRPVDLPFLAGDATRLRGLGWTPSRTLDDALADLWRDVAGDDPAPSTDLAG